MTAQTMRRPSLAEFKQHARHEMKPLIVALLAARLFATMERERVDAYTAPIFAEYAFHSQFDGAPITSERDLYMEHHDSPDYLEYHRRVLAANIEHGWTGNPEHCPALHAEHAVTAAENALLESLSRLFGTDFTRTYGENRAKALELAIDSIRVR